MEQSTKSIVELPKDTIISVQAGSVIVNKRVIAYPSYDGTIDGLLTYYAQMAEIHQWSKTVLTEIIFAVDKRFTVLKESVLQPTPFNFGQEPEFKRHKGILYYGIVMLSLVIMLNISLAFADKHITWSLSTYYVLLGLSFTGCYGAAICFWSYYAHRK